MCHRFGVCISRVDATRNVDKDNAAVSFPFLNRKMLNVNMASTRSRAIFVDYVDSSFIIDIEAGGARLRKAKVREDHT